MKLRGAISAGGFVLAIGVVFWGLRRDERSAPEVGDGGGGAVAANPRMELPEPKEDLSADYLKGYAFPGSDPVRDLVLVKDVLNAFSYSIKTPDALPTSGNRDIISALLGDNPYKIRFLSPRFAHLSTRGELLDRWKTPLYFHFEEATDPGIRSAGPDRKMWTADDVVLEE